MAIIHFTMFNVLRLLLNFALFSSLAFKQCYTAELAFTHVIFRHGDRSPSGAFPTDIYQENIWPQGWGQLTNLGKEQHYKLGQWLQRTYVGNLLSKNYSVSEFYARSSDKDRALQSAASNLAGLYPPNGDQVWDKTSPVAQVWQPIPIHTVPLQEDILLEPNQPCPNFDIIFTEQSQSTVSEINRKFKNFFLYLQNVTGLTTVDFESIGHVYDPINCELSHNLPVPDWVSDVYNETVNLTTWEIIRELQTVSTNLNYNSPEKAHLQSGYLMGDIVKRMQDVVLDKQSPAEKFMMYSGHDGTILGLLYSMNVSNDLLVPYAACVVIDLYKNDSSQRASSYYVNVRYHNETDVEPFDLTLPGCPSFDCPLDTFSSLLQNNLLLSIQDRQVACGLRSSCSRGYSSQISNSRSIFGFIVFTFALFRQQMKF